MKIDSDFSHLHTIQCSVRIDDVRVCGVASRTGFPFPKLSY